MPLIDDGFLMSENLRSQADMIAELEQIESLAGMSDRNLTDLFDKLVANSESIENVNFRSRTEFMMLNIGNRTEEELHKLRWAFKLSCETEAKSHYLGLENWRDSGIIAEAKERIIHAFSMDHPRAVLTLSDLELSTFPPIESLMKIRDLTALNFDGNDLQEIPTGISQLKLLERVSFAGNCLTSIPDSFTELSKLKSVELDRNRFENFPVKLFTMGTLNRITISENNIRALPREIPPVDHKIYVYIAENPIHQFPSVLNVEFDSSL